MMMAVLKDSSSREAPSMMMAVLKDTKFPIGQGPGWG